MSTAPTAAASAGSTSSSANPTAYTQEQLNEAVERARNEERGKLSSELETLRTENATLKTAAQTAATEISTLKNTTETLQKSLTGDGKKIDVAKLVEEVSDRVSKAANAASSERISQLEASLASVNQQLAATTLKETRARLIVEAGGEDALIPELVKGNNEAELRASIAESKAIFDKQKAKWSAPSTVPPAPGSAEPAVKPAVVADPAAVAAGAGGPAGGGSAAPAVAAAQVPPSNQPAPVVTDPQSNPTGLRPVTRVSPAEWRNQREQQLKSLEGRYGTVGATSA